MLPAECGGELENLEDGETMKDLEKTITRWINLRLKDVSWVLNLVAHFHCVLIGRNKRNGFIRRHARWNHADQVNGKSYESEFADMDCRPADNENEKICSR